MKKSIMFFLAFAIIVFTLSSCYAPHHGYSGGHHQSSHYSHNSHYGHGY